MKYECLTCASQSDEKLGMCPVCCKFNQYCPVIQRTERNISPNIEVIPGIELLKRGKGKYKIGGIWDILFPEGIATPFLLNLYSMPGLGKTSLALLLADKWPRESLFCAFETGTGASLSGLVAYLEVIDLDFCTPVYWEDLTEISERYDLIVLDSVQHARIDPGVVRTEFCNRGKNVISISQVNSQGETRGGVAMGHESDISIKLPLYGEFEIIKNRFGDLIKGSWKN